jgi:hypothetical protein
VEKKPPLTLISPSRTGPPPPASLGEAGTDLWRRIMADYDIADCGGKELLLQACGACDRLAELKRCIDEEGTTIRTRGGIRAHPALRDELACRAFIVRTLRALGLDVEPIKGEGRRGGGIGWAPAAR